MHRGDVICQAKQQEKEKKKTKLLGFLESKPLKIQPYRLPPLGKNLLGQCHSFSENSSVSEKYDSQNGNHTHDFKIAVVKQSQLLLLRFFGDRKLQRQSYSFKAYDACLSECACVASVCGFMMRSFIIAEYWGA
ncbi:hypothetical protein BDE02_15G118000 [Populus trichocarpa]|nr:hypothetical protein BDE02_15G118000 [Populus trichocarpa]